MVKQTPEGTIGDTLFDELIRRGYAPEGKSSVWNLADSKLWYLTPSQVKKFEDLKEERNFQKDDESSGELIESHLDKIMNLAGSKQFNFIDLGGAGRNVIALLRKFYEKGIDCNYYTVDLNELMLKRAEKLFKGSLSDTSIKYIPIRGDFFQLSDILKKIRTESSRNCVVFMGRSTFVNFEPNEILFTIKQALTKSDLFILTSSLFSKTWLKRVKKYQSGGKLDLWLFEIISLLGIDRSEVKFLTRFNEKRSEVLYEFLKPKIIESNGRKIIFNKGDKLLVLFSYKHQEEDLMTYLNINFSEVSSFNSKSKIYKLALCKV